MIARQPEPVHRSSTLSTRSGSVDPRRELLGNQLGDERARHDHALVDVEAVAAQPGLVGDVGGRHALVGAALDHGQHLQRLRPAAGARRGRDRACRAAAAACAGPGRPLRRRHWRCRGRRTGLARVEAGDGVAQQVAQRGEIVWGHVDKLNGYDAPLRLLLAARLERHGTGCGKRASRSRITGFPACAGRCSSAAR